MNGTYNNMTTELKSKFQVNALLEGYATEKMTYHMKQTNCE